MEDGMRSIATIVFILAVAVPGFAQSGASGGDDAAIRRVVQQHDDARNRGDWKALGQLFTDDAEQLTSAGEWRRGRPQIEKGVAQAMSTVYKGGKYTTTVQRVRMVAPTVALADGAFEIANLGKGSRRGHTTFVLVKSGDGWRIAATRTMVPTAAGATPSGSD
jgi:uncharacterized protein (TIGR02246 family)